VRQKRVNNLKSQVPTVEIDAWLKYFFHFNDGYPLTSFLKSARFFFSCTSIHRKLSWNYCIIYSDGVLLRLLENCFTFDKKRLLTLGRATSLLVIL